jgi:hypothetical protein
MLRFSTFDSTTLSRFSSSPNGFWVVAGLIAAVFALVAMVLFRFRFKFF